MKITTITASEKIIGHIVKTDEGSYFVQCERANPDHCIDHGINAKYLARDINDILNAKRAN